MLACAAVRQLHRLWLNGRLTRGRLPSYQDVVRSLNTVGAYSQKKERKKRGQILRTAEQAQLVRPPT